MTLVGSRGRGDATLLSDWDLEVDVDDLDRFERDLPEVIAELHPLAHQWDPFGVRHNYMVMLPGPAKVDIIIEAPQEEAGPWVVSSATLPHIEHHFWDWALWLGSKTLHGAEELVRSELAKMNERLLRPLGVEHEVATLQDAVDAYRAARDEAEQRYGGRIDRRLEAEVLPALEGQGIV